MSEVTLHPINLIVSNPDVRRGRPVIVGTGLRVQDVAAAYRLRAETPNEIATHYGISLAEVHAALAYYFQHQAKIDQQIEDDLKFAQSAKETGLGQRHPPVLR
jgi:uncharacterized protein (DUF433 family)